MSTSIYKLMLKKTAENDSKTSVKIRDKKFTLVVPRKLPSSKEVLGFKLYFHSPQINKISLNFSFVPTPFHSIFFLCSASLTLSQKGPSHSLLTILSSRLLKICLLLLSKNAFLTVCPAQNHLPIAPFAPDLLLFLSNFPNFSYFPSKPLSTILATCLPLVPLSNNVSTTLSRMLPKGSLLLIEKIK